MVLMLFSIGCVDKRVDNLKEGKGMLEAANKPGKNEIRNDQLHKAVGYFKAELKNNPDSFEAQIGLAESYGNLLEPDSAIIVLNKGIETKNNEIERLLMERGISYLNKRDYTSSIRDFEEAVKYDPGDGEIYKMIVHSRLSQKYYVNGTWLNFGQQDIAQIIDAVYPADYKNRPSVDELIYDVKMYPYRK